MIKGLQMDRMDGSKDKKVEKGDEGTVSIEVEDEDTFAESSSGANSGARPVNHLLGRRNTGNNLYIKIPANEPEGAE